MSMPLGSDSAQRLERAARLVVDRGIESEMRGQPVAFLRAACNSDDAASFDLSDLTRDRPDRAGGGRNDYGFARLRTPDIQKTEIGSQASNSVDAKKMRHRIHAGNLDELLGGEDRVILPARIGEYEIAGREPRRLRIRSPRRRFGRP